MYATIADLRAEGMSKLEANDVRMKRLLQEASALIDRVTGWYFEPREQIFRLDGRGTPSIEPPVPPIRIDELVVGYRQWPITFEHLVVVGAPIQPGFMIPRLTLCHGRVFPKGQGNVMAKGVWGFTEDNGTPLGQTPPAIQRACMLLVMRNLAPLGDEASFEARSRWRIIEERTRDQSYRLDSAKQSARELTGDPEIDTLLAPYVKPSAFGAA